MKKYFPLSLVLIVLMAVVVSAFTVTKFDIVQLNAVRYQADNAQHWILTQAPSTLSANFTHTLVGATGTTGLVFGATTAGHLAVFNAVTGELVDGGGVGGTCPGAALSGQVLYNNAGVCGGITNATSNGTSIAFTGVVPTTGLTTTGPDFEAGIVGDTTNRVKLGLTTAGDVPEVSFGPGNAVRDLFLQRVAAATLRQGNADSATPVVQIHQVQNGSGTNIAAAATWDFIGPLGTGTGTNGDIRFRVGVKVGSGSGAPTTTTALTLKGETLVSVFPALVSNTTPTIQIGSAANGLGDCAGTNNIGIFNNGVCSYVFQNATPGLVIGSNRFISFNNAANVGGGGTTDLSVERLSTTQIAIGNGQATCGTLANCRDLAQRHNLATGTACTIGSGFGAGAAFVDGGCRDDSFRIGVGTTPGTTGVVTFGTAYTNIPACTANDEGTAVLVRAVATTTQVTVTGTFTNNDVVSVVCRSRV